MFGRSKAEEILLHWKSSSRVAACTGDALKDGRFQDFLEGNGFQKLLDKLSQFVLTNNTTTNGKQKAVEQTWKVLEKMYRRVSPEAAHEVLHLIFSKYEGIKVLLEEFEETYVASGATAKKEQVKIDAARLKYLELRTIHFGETKKNVRLGKMLGKGGMGGAVFLGTDENKNKYAVKVERGTYRKQVFSAKPYAQKLKLDQELAKMYEADVTTTCVDYTMIGPHRCYLLTMGQKVEWEKLTLTDIVSIFYDLHTLHQYTSHYTKVELTSNVELVHLDIHPGNMMMFNGRLRLIDFGKSVIVNTNNIEKVGKKKLDDYASPHLGTVKEMLNVKGDALGKYVANWKSTLQKVNPEVLLCKGCGRQYAQGSKMTECYRCGSKNLEAARLRDEDMVGIAKLKGVNPETLKVDDPLIAEQVKAIKPEQYLCLVLTVNMLKTWIGISRKFANHVGVGNLNSSVYGDARKALLDIKQKAPKSAILVELLLLWFDEMMNHLLTGKSYTAMDAVMYFDPGGNILKKLKGGKVQSSPSRGRSQSVSF